MPFAVVGSNRVMEMNGRKVRGRQYPWGTVEVDNMEHNDFLALRDMLIRYAIGSRLDPLPSMLLAISNTVLYLQNTHAGPERCHEQCPLRELQVQ